MQGLFSFLWGFFMASTSGSFKDIPLSDMTLRDFIAINAMAAMLANPNREDTPEYISEDAYGHADCMLEVRRNEG